MQWFACIFAHIDEYFVLRRIRETWRTRFVPVVMLTTSMEASDLSKSYELGANSYVRKPVDSVEFGEAVKNLGDYWLHLNEAQPVAL